MWMVTLPLDDGLGVVSNVNFTGPFTGGPLFFVVTHMTTHPTRNDSMGTETNDPFDARIHGCHVPTCIS